MADIFTGISRCKYYISLTNYYITTMKFIHILLCAASLAALTACGSKEKDELSHHHHEHEHAEGHEHGEAEEHEGHEHEGNIGNAAKHSGDEIALDRHTAERFGVKVDTVSVEPFGSVVKVGGRVLPSAGGNAAVAAPGAGILTLAPGIDVGSEVRKGQTIGTVRASGMSGGDPNKAAKVELDAARAEFERIKPLYEERLVTKARYNAALADYERAKAAYSAPAASGAVVSPITGVITSLEARSGSYVETGGVVAAVAASSELSLQADVPARLYPSVAAARDARIVLPYSSQPLLLSSMGGRRLNSTNSTAGAAAGYVPVVFSFRNDGSVMPGTSVEVYLLGDSDRNALTVPSRAITEQQGEYYVFVRIDEDCYRKVPVSPGVSDGENTEVLSGLHGGEAVVCDGVTAVRLAQSSGAVPAGHSHSH